MLILFNIIFPKIVGSQKLFFLEHLVAKETSVFLKSTVRIVMVCKDKFEGRNTEKEITKVYLRCHPSALTILNIFVHCFMFLCIIWHNEMIYKYCSTAFYHDLYVSYTDIFHNFMSLCFSIFNIFSFDLISSLNFLFNCV